MRLGVIDLGSNTILLVIYRWDGLHLKTLNNIKRQTQSIKYVKNALMSKEGLDSVVLSVKELMVIARAYDVEKLNIFATASLRNIKNSDEAVSYIQNEIDYPLDLLDGNKESLFGF